MKALGTRKVVSPKGNMDFVRKERSEGVSDVKVNGKVIPVFQESTWNEYAETTTGLFFDLEGNRRSALTGHLATDDLSTYAEQSGFRRVHCDGRRGCEAL